jgi:hypothetical protein
MIGLRARVKSSLQKSSLTNSNAGRQDAVRHLTTIGANKGLDPNVHIPQAIVNDLEAAVKV